MGESKSLIRKKIDEQLHLLTDEEFDEKSKLIRERLFQTEDWQNSSTIGITIAIRREVDTYPIIEEAWKCGKVVTVPKTFPQAKEMDFYRITSWNDLETVAFDLSEPKISHCQKYDHREIDLLIVPGIAFTQTGYRLGYGGGYYDRYLQHYQGKIYALAFELQMVPHLPIESFDLPVETIITESEIYT